MNKELFLKQELVNAIRQIPADTLPAWGKMNLQQMTEHLSREGFSWSSGKIPQQLVTPAEHVPKMQAFIMSEKMFRENTPNGLMADEPPPLQHADMNAALTELQQEIDYFFDVFEHEPDKKVLSPFFGALDREMQVQLLYKHALHHLRQFGTQL